MRVTDEEAGIIAEKIQHGTEMKLEGFDDMEGIVQATVEPPVEDFPTEIETPAVEEPPAPQVLVETPVEEPEQNDEFDDTGGL